jgi:uncharacterized protein
MFNKIMMNVVLSLSALLIGATAYSKPIQPQTLEKLIEVSNFNQLIKESNKDLKPFFDQQAEYILKSSLSVNELNKSQKIASVQISQLLSEINETITNDPKFITLVKESYKANFTEEEALTYIDFLSTPIGKSINQKSSLVTNQLIHKTSQFSEELLANPEYNAKFNKKVLEIIEPLMVN